ncbi:MAG: tetratricopeptide repeat protein, partial [Candidatus Marinimicrobia bacterium]|nr:tetratricopeptide repeat protein [Candidatus Neomarinimicrobiota bacterium]
MNAQDTFAAATRYYESGDLKKAGQLCQKILKHDPNHFEALFNFGNILKDLGKYTEALSNYSRAIRLRPNFPEVYYNLGIVLINIRKFREAEHSFELAIKMNPDFAEAYYYLGITQKSQEKNEDAIKNFSHAIQLNPEFIETYNELGLALSRLGELEQSEKVFRKILRLNPNYAIAYNNLANLLQKQGRFSEALSYSNRALDLVPNFYEALFSKSLIYLLKGDLEKGWPGFEYRWKLTDVHKKRFDKPQWKGESLKGKTIFLWAEQGLGDTIQFIRYVSLIKKCSGKAMVQWHPYLLEILSSVEGIDRLVSKDEEALDFDFHIPLLSLPGIFKTTLDTIPSDIPYINSPPEYKDKFHEIFN